ncbi:hypothetical protein AC249_AIPGENE15642 [Exaiptasia diaphana]|nr:hypothetical protein AC249_AIPGENE15642 [Exaiptasia diaphana]
MAYRQPQPQPSHYGNHPTTGQRPYKRRKCYVCGGRGHTASKCPSPDDIRLMRDPTTCTNCGVVGHASLACPTPSNRGTKEERMAAFLNNIDEAKNSNWKVVLTMWRLGPLLLGSRDHRGRSKGAVVIRTLVHRKENLLSDDDVKQAEQEHLTIALLENGYHSSFFERHSISPKNNKITDEEPSQPKGFATLPYVKGSTERIRKVLTANNIKSCMRPEVTLRHVLSHPKDRVVADKKAGIVYSIPCGECDIKYIGETGRSLKTRRSEHISAVKHLNAKKSALAEHANNTGHSIDRAATSVVATETKSQQRKWMEGCQIAKGKNILFNRDKGRTLPGNYLCFLNN